MGSSVGWRAAVWEWERYGLGGGLPRPPVQCLEGQRLQAGMYVFHIWLMDGRGPAAAGTHPVDL